MGDVAAMGALRAADIGGPVWPRQRGGGARRCLFGPPDPEKTRTFLESETKRLSEESRSKWNFDFAQGEPLESGRFVWTPNPQCEGKEKMQTRITDFMRKRKLATTRSKGPSPEEEEEEPRTKTRRRFST